ncbi:MAG: hypothetical protein A3A86_01745 [Elusimicrobia bacterium RIFCSPLOWO2_01_FULL_60_11]|nr:MAG: hypothetical protein A3A86_01745 [Elusimicrobia bacterium RIFCSPLOWO2_01_FULL_60_11]
MAALRSAWEAWKKFSLIFGTFMSRVILTVIYFTAVLPWGAGIRLFGDPLDIRRASSNGWKPHPASQSTLKEFLRQF